MMNKKILLIILGVVALIAVASIVFTQWSSLEGKSPLVTFLGGDNKNKKPENKSVPKPDEAFCQGPVFGTMFYNGAIKRTDRQSEDHKELFTELWDYGFVAGTPDILYMQPTAGYFKFVALDATIKWFKDNGLTYGLYHNIITPKFRVLPQWYIGAESQAERRQMLENYVRAIVSHYKGIMPAYVVVNHVVNNSFNTPEYENNYLLTGWSQFETVKKMLEWAHEEDPVAKLIINETGTDFSDMTVADEENNQDYFNLVKELVAAGAPLDGLGIMAHLGGYTGKMPANEDLQGALDQYASTGVPIYVTELDLSYNFMEDPLDPQEPFEGFDNYWEYQADGYKRAFSVFNSHPDVAAVYMWGFVDSGAWREGEGLFDEQFNPKPAYFAVKDFLLQKKQCADLAL